MLGYAVGFCEKGEDPKVREDFRIQEFMSVPFPAGAPGDVSRDEWDVMNLKIYHAAVARCHVLAKENGYRRPWTVVRADSDEGWVKKEMEKYAEGNWTQIFERRGS